MNFDQGYNKDGQVNRRKALCSKIFIENTIQSLASEERIKNKKVIVEYQTIIVDEKYTWNKKESKLKIYITF